MTGIVVRIVRGQKIGFIKGDADAKSYYFSKGAVGHMFDDLREGQAVSFTLTRKTPPRGPRCARVTIEGPA
jgi:cold shock CspA family protein